MLWHDIIVFVVSHAGTMQCAFFVAVLTIAWIAEWRVLQVSAAEKAAHTYTNALLLICGMPVQLVMTAIVLAVAATMSAHKWGLAYMITGGQPTWVRYLLTFLMLDFLDYAYHFLAHNVPHIWNFHLTHHTDRQVDVSTTFREHPGETLIRVSFLILWVALCGASIGVLVLRQTVETISNVSQHTTFRLPPTLERVLGWLFVTPNLHHAHHHFRLPGTNCNYGDVFSIWDRIFGTYAEIAPADIVFGLDSHMNAGMKEILSAPLRQPSILQPSSDLAI